uniref:Uncharacterized protein n=1 Tax=Arundo donax TaxID=35708 RepID=A0A0A8YAJ5_ARUDO
MEPDTGLQGWQLRARSLLLRQLQEALHGHLVQENLQENCRLGGEPGAPDP